MGRTASPKLDGTGILSTERSAIGWGIGPMSYLFSPNRITDLLNLGAKPIFVLWLMSWSIALTPVGAVLIHGEFKEWAWVVSLASTAYLLALLVLDLGARVNVARTRWHIFQTLSRTEKECLRQYYDNNTSSVVFGNDDGPPNSLVLKGILIVPLSDLPRAPSGSSPYLLVQWASDFLQKWPDALK